MALLEGRPSQAEIDRVMRIAHGAYGWALPLGRILDICRLVRGQPVIDEGYNPPRHILRHIARDHLETWELVRPTL